MRLGLGERLMEVFKTRAEKVVFVKGDPALEFRDVAKAIDIAKGRRHRQDRSDDGQDGGWSVNAHEEGECNTRRWNSGTGAVCHGLREAEGARPLEQGMIVTEVEAARAKGVQVEGVCLYPIIDHVGWDDDRDCPSGLLGSRVIQGRREVHTPLAAAIQRWRRNGDGSSSGSADAA